MHAPQTVGDMPTYQYILATSIVHVDVITELALKNILNPSSPQKWNFLTLLMNMQSLFILI